MTKKCTKCAITKSYDDFYKSKVNLDGLEGSCKSCKSHYIKDKWRNSQSFRDRHSEYSKKKSKFTKSERSHACNECGIAFITTTAPNTTNKCRRCAKIAAAKKWTSINLAYKAHARALRRTALLQRTPKWLNENEKRIISLYYKTARWIQSILDIPIEVDHIVPLQGKNVSGLHVPSNLQLLTKHDNCSKGAKYEQR